METEKDGMLPFIDQMAQERSLFMTNKFESKYLQKFYVSSKHEKECYMKTTSYLEDFHLLLLSFVVDGLFTTPVYSPRRGRFVNSAFPNKKNLAKQRILFMTNKFESKCLHKFYVSSKHEKECYMKTTFYLEEPNRHFCQHFMRRTTQETFSAINLASQQKTTKLFFSSQVRKQFKLLAVPLKPLRCCLRSDKLVNCHVWKFYKDLFLHCRVSSWPDLSIKSYFFVEITSCVYTN